MQTISVFLGGIYIEKNRRKQKITGRDLNFGYHKKWFYFLFEVFLLNNDDDIMAAIMRTHLWHATLHVQVGPREKKHLTRDIYEKIMPPSLRNIH